MLGTFLLTTIGLGVINYYSKGRIFKEWKDELMILKKTRDNATQDALPRANKNQR